MMRRARGRRAFLRTAALTAAAVPFSQVFSRRAAASPFGPLRPDPKKILDLPEGFSYRILERSHARMSDGYRVPGRPDGMGCFPGPAGTVVLMRNHECYPDQRDYAPWGPGQRPPLEVFDPKGMGGVTRVVVRTDTFERVSSNLVLAGTNTNCAGGWSPWGWLSCEESVSPGHGYVFVCPTDADRVQPARMVRGYGRFYHEAAVVDPDTMIAYLTEDRDDSAFYRFVPDRPEEPFVGRLQALRVVGHDRLDTSVSMRPGEVAVVDWVDIADPDPRDDTVRKQAQEAGAAMIKRGEGLTRHGGAVYLCATTGGPVAGGQIFRYSPGKPGTGGTLEVVAESTDRNALDMPDNITSAPWGDLYMVEDGRGDNHVVALNEQGETFRFARNALSDSEMAGVCFSPDGRALFLNIQDDGLTLVVTGPFPTPDGVVLSALRPEVATPEPKKTPEPLPSGKAEGSTGCGACAAGGEAGAIGGAVTGAGALAWLLRRVCSRE